METIMPAFLPYTPMYYSQYGKGLLENVIGPLELI
jgi:hypothetical protein